MHKVKVIPPILAEQKEMPLSIKFDNSKTNISYFGAFYKNVRSPEPLLKFLSFIRAHHISWLEDKCFHFFGQANRFSQGVFESYWELKDYIQINGLIDRQVVHSQMKATDVLLNFGNTTSYHLPSKCVDYLASEKPIINVVQNRKDSFRVFAKNYEPIIHLELNEELNFEKTFGALTNFVQQPRAVKKIDLKKYAVEQIAKDYLET